MKHLLYIFLVLAALFAAIYLLPERSPLFEYYRLRPIFEISSILLLIVVLYLYRREKRQVKMIFSRLSQKNFFLDLAIQCGGIYIWEFKDEEFFFKYPVGDQPSRIELEEMWKLIHPDDLIAFKLQRQSLWKADKEVFQCRARFAGSDYEWWEFRFSAMPALDNAEGGKDVSGILININDMKKREKELILMRGYEQKFLANMSHEIRTPLNSIVGFSNLLASEKDLDEADKQLFAKTINQSCDLLLVLINDILDMSRIESGTVKLDNTEVHLPDVLHDLRTIIQGNISAKQLDLYIDTQDVHHEDIITDKLRLNQVLLNIVGNSVKFTPAGGTINIRVEEKPSARSGYATFVFSVKDNGIGMSKDFQAHVFDSFSREQTATRSGIQGTGLGMAISKNIVDMMGGTIAVKSEQGKGSEFTVTLDCKVCTESVKYPPIPGLKGTRALVVDDDAQTCMSVSKMLREIEMEADWTTSGKEAILRAREAHNQGAEFKVYIIDWLMPDMNGIETVRRIRKVIEPGTPIIILTAYDWADIEDEARQAGVTAFVSKPLFMSELRDALTHKVVSGRQPLLPKHGDYTGKKVLLVEDNELNREIATAILEEAGLKVDAVEDGTDAVARMNEAAEDEYDLILMDIQMPKMDGYTATREIRTLSSSKKANIPIVAMTANAFEEDRQKAFKAGMNAHIAKPIDVNILMGTLDNVFKQNS